MAKEYRYDLFVFKSNIFSTQQNVLHLSEMNKIHRSLLLLD